MKKKNQNALDQKRKYDNNKIKYENITKSDNELTLKKVNQESQEIQDKIILNKNKTQKFQVHTFQSKNQQ